jgi:hypothetical protein
MLQNFVVIYRFMDPTGNWFMHKYYTDRKVLFCMCAGKDQRIK